MGTIVAAIFTALRTSRAAQALAVLVVVILAAGALYLYGFNAGEDRAGEKAAGETVKDIEKSRTEADKVERRIDDKEDRELIECVRRNNC